MLYSCWWGDFYLQRQNSERLLMNPFYRVVFFVVLSVGCTVYIILVNEMMLHDAGRHQGRWVSTTEHVASTNRFRNDQWQQWYKRRQELLREPGVPRKVLFFCYMRGGSTIGGEMFNRDPHAVLWYEPLAAYYTTYYGTDYFTKPQVVQYNEDMSQINFTRKEINRLVEFFEKSFNCDLDQLPAQTWLHRSITNSEALKPIKKCIKHIRKGGMMTSYPSPAKICGDLETSRKRMCPEILQAAREFLDKIPENQDATGLYSGLELYLGATFAERNIKRYKALISHIVTVERLRKANKDCLKASLERCKQTRLSVMEILRIKLSLVEPILTKIPDMYIVFYIRDPRAIVASRLSGGLLASKASTSDVVGRLASDLCQTIRDDLNDMYALQAKYDDVFVRTRYEDLILDPVGTAERIYRSIGLEYPEDSQWPSFAEYAFNSAVEDGRFGVRRSNSSEHIDKWRTTLEAEHLAKINQICKDVIVELGYQV